MLTRIKIFPVSNYKQDDIYRNKNPSAFLQKKIQDIIILFHDFPGLEMVLLNCMTFYDFPGRVVTLDITEFNKLTANESISLMNKILTQLRSAVIP